uniref:Secreted protein n=1 Tax=Mesocestoides corti TaxID=53468 RepID=A0A5K3EP13_MESCO
MHITRFLVVILAFAALIYKATCSKFSWQTTEDEVFEISVYYDTSNSFIMVFPLLRLRIDEDVSLCGFYVEPPHPALNIKIVNSSTGVGEIVLNSNGTEDLDGSLFYVRGETCEEPKLHTVDRPLRVYIIKPSYPFWKWPVLWINVPTRLEETSTLAELSEVSASAGNLSICNYSIESGQMSLFTIDQNGMSMPKDYDELIENACVFSV